MKRVLEEDIQYPYLKENAQTRLNAARILVKNTALTHRSLVGLGGLTKCWFPWLGTRSFRTLVRYLKVNAEKFSISNISYDGCNYICFRLDKGTEESFVAMMQEDVGINGIRCGDLVFSGETPVIDKYDPYIPSELLKKAYSIDKLRPDEVENRILFL